MKDQEFIRIGCVDKDTLRGVIGKSEVQVKIHNDTLDIYNLTQNKLAGTVKWQGERWYKGYVHGRYMIISKVVNPEENYFYFEFWMKNPEFACT